MNIIDQNKAFTSFTGALVPAPSLLDGRTERDMLGFLSDFASLINFYDSDNSLSGNWAPFLLKDSIFLQASISKTDFSKYHFLYLNTCIKLEKAIASITDNASDVLDITFSFNRLFDQLIAIFMQIKRWVYYMQRSDDEYKLKAYVIHHVKTTYSRYFWAIISLKQNLFLSSAIKGIEPVDENNFLFFDTYGELVWKQNKDNSPYWEILGLKYPIKENTKEDFFQSLTQVGDDLFIFFNTIIEHSINAFEDIKINKSKYPDTTLLRVFVNLLKVHQDQLNNISHKHLEFYYKDILQQTPQPATPDEVFISTVLAKKDTTLTLPAGTLFNAGFDEKKNVVVFSTEKEVIVNPATVVGAFTLTQVSVDTNFSSLYFQNIPTPGLLQKDNSGKAKTWATFGDITSPATLLKLDVAIASPLLLLKEGRRSITLDFTFAKEIDLSVLQNAIVSLSTQTAWLKVTAPAKYSTGSTTKDKVTLQIDLFADQPAIEFFSQESIVYKSGELKDAVWPMVKMEFGAFPDFENPPVLLNCDIKVNVTGVKTFQLYNDYGLLDEKTFQPFGPAPLLNSAFMIGSDEIFSKPLNALAIELDWDTLPSKGFTDYYQQYNESIHNLIYPKKPVEWRKSIVDKIKNIFRFKKPDPQLIYDPFNNVCFTVNFSILQNKSWKALNMLKKKICTVEQDNNTFSCSPYLQDTTCKNCKVVHEPNLLFSTDGTCVLAQSSFFGYDQSSSVEADYTVDPNIQNVPVKFSKNTAFGFMKIGLSGPEEGFGSAIYPNVVYETAIANASILKTKKQKADFKSQPLVPFVPKLTSFTANYTASGSYDFTKDTSTYPLQIFLYSPFGNYTAYDNTAPSLVDYTHVISKPAAELDIKDGGVNLFTPLVYKSFLFIAMNNLVTADSINFYFELARGERAIDIPKKQIGYFYLSTTGWNELSLLSDETNNFSCSGIIQLNVPNDIANKTAYKSDSFWFVIAVKDDPASFAQTFFLQTNGIKAKRLDEFLPAGVTPSLPANTIIKPQTAIPKIASVLQPFPSFGGKAAEDMTVMNRRIGTRLKTKDRVISQEDYFRIIRQEFTDIFYSKYIFNPTTKKGKIYVVKSYENYTELNAFKPLISSCSENKMEDYLNSRSSAFAAVDVSNFAFQYVQVVATVLMKQGFESEGVVASINDALNIYLSPWIKSTITQIQIDQGISDTDTVNFIENIEGVSHVASVSFISYAKDIKSGKLVEQPSDTPLPAKASNLLVSYMNHSIKCKAEE
jgi:hypothetical protein